jgi:hypothetical protein
MVRRSNMATRYTCKHCKKVLTKIGVVSVCRQTYHFGSDSYEDLSVDETAHGFCLECSSPIPDKDLKRITGLDPSVIIKDKMLGGIV